MRRLAGKRIFLTGVTGFLGQVILERLLADFPETSIVLLVRSQTGASSVDRVHYLTRKPSFDRLRGSLGSDDALLRLLDERIEVVDGDFSRSQPDIPGDIDVVIHSAATVAFDPPIDEAFQTNLFGAMNLYRAVLAGGSRPALVHVSTAYVAGVQKGVIPERTLDHRVDWGLEADLALQARRDVEASSRKPELLERFLEDASKEHSRAGPTTVADDAEQRRKDWMTKRLVEYGRQRARSLGWPDVYTFTKAMGERAVEELAAAEKLPLSIVRPSIIESALLHPAPGWIDGFKMADPIIRAYGLGQIPEFPGIPEGIVDIIPVDFVVNAILAVAATPPSPGEPAHYHISSGDRNPLQFHQLYALVREYFEAHPLPERGRGEHKVPEWTFPGNVTVEKMLRRAERLTDIAEQVVTHLPKSKGMRDAVRRVDRDKARVDFVKRYSDLYGAYTEAEVIYTDDVAMALYESLSKEDRARFPFDAAAIDWKHYLQDVHSPAVTRSLRELSRTRPRAPERQDPGARGAGPRRLRHGGDDHLLQRRRVLRVGEDGRPRGRRVAERAGGGLRPDPAVPGDRPPRSRGLPSHVLPAVRGCLGRGPGEARRSARGGVHAPEGESRRDPPDPRTSSGGAPHPPAHRRRERVPPPAGPAVRPRDRRRPPDRRRGSLHGVHVDPAARR